MGRAGAAAIVAALSVGAAGCAGDGGGTASAGSTPLAVARVAQASLVSRGARAKGSRHRARTAIRRSVPGPVTVPPALDVATPPSPRRPRAAARPTLLDVTAAAGLAKPVCEQFAAARAGELPAAVLARGSARALALLTDSVASALLGLPVDAPRASRHAREDLDDARARIERALASGDDAKADAVARATATRIARYARALGIADCG